VGYEELLAGNRMTQVTLSVIIISKNEEKNIAKCIESVLKAIKDIDCAEVILVDSASTDKTVEIAKNYPVKIIQLDPSVPLSPSAGRYIGFLNSHGKYIQFIDGDMTLDKNWFKYPFKIFKENKKIAGVAGLTLEKESTIQEERNCTPKYVDVLTGAALFRRDALEEVGPYNPFIYGDEEAELCYRLRYAGYKLLKLPYNMVMHYGRRQSIGDFKIRISRKYYLGCGQTLRYSIGRPRLFLAHLCRLKVYILNIFWLFIGFISLGIIILSDEYIYLIMWLLGTLLFSAIQLIRKKSLYKLLLSLVSKNLFSLGILLGFFLSPKNPEVYPKKFRYIKK